MKFGVVVFPGSNCDRDVMDALKNDLQQQVIPLWHKDRDLSMFNKQDCIVLPGGFSFGDYLRCGAIARFSPMMQSVIEFANKGGKVLGICNGFQILCESGLLPGVLLRNSNMQFVCKNVLLIGENKKEKKNVLKIPVAHGEGRYYASEEVINKLEKEDQVLYRYCNTAGLFNVDYSPNGSTNNIAGICNKERNVFAMMPHPERACNSLLGNTDGRQVFLDLFSIN
ncbi:phosphoribosylformylglycinamidine synthase subunit PurQ [Ginsengibacter hankyongi]|uniref:Phosphoribosylformylglycinamidine synthase subunit PurQ n=1 Tax=Ginsengibacter hankyongi TaxID=2607284 RepID=A0A5J5IK78_9BACT|nr:phosphoribosylformylglycinamidine synthase subunit PurQ [Ginsengibacter hankyongi]KAA9041420.1 phosphoribosylformylglycinamidine synthase subunit PurQ [Ginsengibacter hankyongi]